ncbi:MAG: hypothetical protein Pars2KO_24400 [Parasphingorhabdus sp.]
MATLVLTAAGTALGGPIGGALGALVGQQIDQNILFKPAAQEGPKIQELAVQTSSYGTQIPKIFGRMRVAGSVIWATDLKETKNTEGGKGRPKTTTYSYSACFAVALSSRPIETIGRIWADGKVFRGIGGDFKTTTGFRFFKGQEDQQIDSLIASAEGVNATPAFRGMAIAVFEDMELADYGNRIPSLTFEIVGDDGSVKIVDIVDEITDHKIKITSAEQLHGYSASGENRRTAIEAIAESYLLSFSAGKEHILGCSRVDPDSAIGNLKSEDFVADANGLNVARPQFESIAEVKIPRQFSLRYYEPERDYQSGLQTSFRPGKSRIAVKRDFPAAIDASQAKCMCQNHIWNLYHERSLASIDVTIGSQLGGPGSLVQLDDSRNWIIRSCELRAGTASVSMTSVGNWSERKELGSDGGRSISDRDILAGETRLLLLDLPFAPEAPNQAAASAQLFAVAAGKEGWRNADLYQTLADGSVGEFAGKISSPAILGLTEDRFLPGSAVLRDQETELRIRLHHPQMTLNDANDEQLSAGKNIAIIGREITQFAKAEPLGDGRYTLSRFYRGLGGTERHIENHNSGENFIFFDPLSAALVSPSHYTLFRSATFGALGRDDSVLANAKIESPGNALRPWQPVHLKHRINNTGDLEVTWTRRSRVGSSWLDYVDIPLAETAEEYLISWEASSGDSLGEILVEAPYFSLPESQVSYYRNQGISLIRISVQQRGQYTLSAPSILTVSV